MGDTFFFDDADYEFGSSLIPDPDWKLGRKFLSLNRISNKEGSLYLKLGGVAFPEGYISCKLYLQILNDVMGESYYQGAWENVIVKVYFLVMGESYFEDMFGTFKDQNGSTLVILRLNRPSVFS